MTELSDADREMVAAIIKPTGLEWDAEYNGVLETARRLITAEILAMAKIDEAQMVKAMVESARARLGLPGNTRPSAAMMAASKADMIAAFAAIQPELARLAAENEQMRCTLESAYCILAFAFQRIHGLPRSRDTELASDIEKIRAQIEVFLRKKSKAALGEKP